MEYIFPVGDWTHKKLPGKSMSPLSFSFDIKIAISAWIGRCGP
jgi:hypothetical protein